MRLLKCQVSNFCSYKELEFDFSDLSLALISGPTGSGKSTIPDMPCWILFGATSKGGSVDEVRSWGCDEVTTGIQQVELPDGVTITVTRKRGKPSQNDLYWTEGQSLDPIRGKDITETQKKLELRLGVNVDLYMTASYLHGFSDSFFTAKPKDRREILEKIVDMTLPIKLAESTSLGRKISKADLEEKNTQLAREQGKEEQLLNSIQTSIASEEKWDETQAKRLQDLSVKFDNFETEKSNKIEALLSKLEALDKMILDPREFDKRLDQSRAQIKQLAPIKAEKMDLQESIATAKAEISSIKKELAKLHPGSEDECPLCLGPMNNPKRNEQIATLEASLKEYESAMNVYLEGTERLDVVLKSEDKLRAGYDKIRVDQANNTRLSELFDYAKSDLIVTQEITNHYAEQIEAAKAAQNPYVEQVSKARDQLRYAAHNIDNLNQLTAGLTKRISGLNWLYDTSFAWRGRLLANKIKQIETQANAYLEKHFDAEIRIALRLENQDKLNVQIQKSGNIASFTQLSKGQRCMLKLSFGISLMRAAEDKAGVKFSTLMFDEALDGLDNDLKVKSFGLFQELESDYESILLIDHCPEFKGMFSRQFNVNLVGDASEVSQHAGAED
jgi:DNA repair exonuclease SbcCD ATPase subunit